MSINSPSGATKLQRIKRAVEIEKGKSATAKAREEALMDEKKRLHTQVAADLEHPVESVAALEIAIQEIYARIETNLDAMEKVCTEEGVQF